MVAAGMGQVAQCRQRSSRVSLRRMGTPGVLAEVQRAAIRTGVHRGYPVWLEWQGENIVFLTQRPDGRIMGAASNILTEGQMWDWGLQKIDAMVAGESEEQRAEHLLSGP